MALVLILVLGLVSVFLQVLVWDLVLALVWTWYGSSFGFKSGFSLCGLKLSWSCSRPTSFLVLSLGHVLVVFVFLSSSFLI